MQAGLRCATAAPLAQILGTHTCSSCINHTVVSSVKYFGLHTCSLAAYACLPSQNGTDALICQHCHTPPHELTSGCSTRRPRLLRRPPPAAPQSRGPACTGWPRPGRSAAAGPDRATAELPLSRPGMRLQAAMRCLHIELPFMPMLSAPQASLVAMRPIPHSKCSDAPLTIHLRAMYRPPVQ